MTTLSRGQTQTLTALFFSAPGMPSDVTGLTLNVISLANGSVVLGPIVAGFGHPALGIYTYAWAIPNTLPTGDYLVNWNGLIGADAISAVETVTVIGSSNFSAGPCQNYDFITMCTLTGASAAVSGYAVEAASEILYYATAQQFDTCQVTLRPCRKTCSDGYWPYQMNGWWEYGTSPRPALINGSWYNVVCGDCGENCSCTTISEVILPGPVQTIIEIKVDGVVLVKDVDYRLDDYRKVVRLGGNVWPFCNDLNKNDTQVGTWSITAIYGLPLPTLGKLAMGELVCDIIADILGADCNLPPNITELTRQGVTMTFETIEEAMKSGFEGLKYVDKFITRYNPNGLRARPFTYDLDAPTFRAVGTS